MWPDENYRLIASAPGHVSLESAVVYGPAGEVTAVEPFVLSRNDMKLEGRVVDSDGRPLEGATVLNSGDADKRLVSTTGSRQGDSGAWKDFTTALSSSGSLVRLPRRRLARRRRRRTD